MMNPVSTAFERELEKLIQARIEILSENIVGGMAVSSMEEYREAVGRIAELKEVLSLCEEAASTVNRMR
jgi:hypothetical protein